MKMSIASKISNAVKTGETTITITEAEFEEIKSHINTSSTPLPELDLPSLVFLGKRVYFNVVKQ